MAAQMAAPILSIENLSKRFGGISALTGLSFTVRRGEVLGLIGPNGAGKTTAINVISGSMRPEEGAVRFRDEDITGLPTHLISAKGLVRTFQIAPFFQHLTVFDHLLIASLQRQRPNPLSLFFHTPAGLSKEKEARQRATELLHLMGLAPYAQSLPRHLAQGYQRWLALTIAVALDPSLLLLDEPLSGMNAEEIDSTLALLRKLQRQRGLSILLVEHNMRAVMGFCDRVVVLHYGRKICEGEPAVVSRDPAVVEAYLGGEDGGTA